MSLNEVNYQKVLSDPDSYPSDLEILVQTTDPSCSIQRQKFGCHRLLLSIASPYFRSRLRNPEHKWLLFNETNPEAFKNVVDFIYYKRPFKVQPSGLGSNFSYIKLVLEVLCLAVKCRLPKLVKFCEELVEKKITLTTANSQQVQDFLSSNKDVTMAARKGLLLKYKSVARRRLIKSGVPAEERNQQLEAEMHMFATAANAGDLATDFNSSFRSVAPSTPNQTARSMYYQTSASMYQEEEGDEIVIDASPPRTSVTCPPQMADSSPLAVSPQSTSPRYSPLQQPSITPLAASSSQQLAPTISLASHSFLGCSSPPQPQPDVGNLFDAYNNNEESYVDNMLEAAPNNNPVGGFEVPRFASTPNPYLAAEHNTAPTEAPRFTSTPNPYLETEPNPEPTHMANSSPTFEELVRLVKNIRNLSRSSQTDLVEHIKKLERENPSLVVKLHQQLNTTDLQ